MPVVNDPFYTKRRLAGYSNGIKSYSPSASNVEMNRFAESAEYVGQA